MREIRDAKIHDRPPPLPGTTVVIERGDAFRRLVSDALRSLDRIERDKERQLAEEARAWAKSTGYGQRAGSRKALQQVKGSMLLLGDYDRLIQWCRRRLHAVPNVGFLRSLPKRMFKPVL